MILDAFEIDSDTSSSLAFSEPESLAADSDMEGTYELLRSDASDVEDLSLTSDVGDENPDQNHKLISKLSDESDVDTATVIGERFVNGPNGTTREYLVQCWIPQKHMELFRELMRMS
ncbi:hypothetical protein BDV06DRAFT_208262 [Aspergillus oleicola]